MVAEACSPHGSQEAEEETPGYQHPLQGQAPDSLSFFCFHSHEKYCFHGLHWAVFPFLCWLYYLKWFLSVPVQECSNVPSGAKTQAG